jgi:shikimate dehydrogenase
VATHKRAYIFGCPVGHSISPEIHNAAFEACGLPVSYSAREVKSHNLPEAVRELRSDDVVGANITVPHKEAVMSLVDEIDDEAHAIGAVNTIHNRGGRLWASNTDAMGFARSLLEAGIEVQGAAVLILGAGGAARAVATALLSHGVRRLLVANRTTDRAQRLTADLKARFSGPDIQSRPLNTLSANDSQKCELIVNTTTIGLRANEAALPGELLPPHGAVVDLIYDPPRTSLLHNAERAGLKTLNGLPMLVHQAAASWETWTRRPAPLEAMRSAARSALSAQR